MFFIVFLASGGGQPLLYQTPQGMMYAAAAATGLPEGYVLNLPQTFPTQPDQSNNTQAGQSTELLL